ncbi:MAG: hypothetical protein M3524_07270 [Actinomycetota bacterium]|nr:hypothetical protein [Actinomycetota bacterium]
MSESDRLPWPSGRAARLLFPTSRSDLRLSWHSERDCLVVSLWRNQECVGSAPLGPADSAEVASFIVSHLGSRASWGPRLVTTAPAERRWLRLRSWSDAVRGFLRSS